MDFERAVLSITGAAEMEELDQSEIAGFQHFLDHPLNINSASRSKLVASGLLSRYQVESLIEYRCSSGDILSFTELSMVDGFNKRVVDNLRLFISLSSERDVGKRQYNSCPQTIKLQGTYKGSGSLWLKYNGEFAERVEVNIANRVDFPSPEIGIGTIGAAYYGKGVLGKIVVGNFNARFGQGLTLWSGTTRSGFSTASSFVRNGSGISLTQSLSSGLRGVAADFSADGFEFSAGYGDCGMAFLAAEKIGRSWTAGITALCYGSGLQMKRPYVKEFSGCISGNFKIGYTGGAVFGEVAYEKGGALAGLLGTFWVPSYGNRLSLVARYYPAVFKGSWSGAVRSSTKVSDEHGVAFGASGRWGDATLDAAWHPSKRTMQYKLIAGLSPEIAIGPVSIIPSARLNARYSTAYTAPWRIDLRVQADIRPGAFLVSARYNTVHSKAWSWMSYLEGGFDSDFRIFLRGGLFKIDNWDDRIYVYERDAPGNFNSPALYGRGWWTSLLAGLKIKSEKRVSHALYLRASYTAYPFMSSPKPSKYELKLQYAVSF